MPVADRLFESFHRDAQSHPATTGLIQQIVVTHWQFPDLQQAVLDRQRAELVRHVRITANLQE